MWERRFAPSEHFPKCCGPAQKSSLSSGFHPKADFRQRLANRSPQRYEPLMKYLLSRVLRPVHQKNATAHLPKLEAATKTSAVGLRGSSCRRTDKRYRQVLPMAHSRTVEARWEMSANSPRPCAGAMTDRNGSRPRVSRHPCGNLQLHRRLHGSHCHPR